MTTENKSDSKEFNVGDVVRPMQDIYDSLENLSYEWRVQQLKTLRKMVDENREEFVDALFKDLGKEKVEATISEIIKVIEEIDFIMAHLRGWMKEQHVPSPTLFLPCLNKLRPKPLRAPGILVIGPCNYPLALNLVVAAGTLAAGNPTLIKPSELTPYTTSLLSKYVGQYFVHNKALQVVEGDAKITKTLTQQPWGKIVFTGSERVGKLVATEAAKTLTPCVLELGGKSPCYVDYETTHKSLALDVMANRIIWGKTFNSGQTCVGIDYLIIDEKHVDTLCPELVASIQRQYGTNPEKSEISRMLTSTTSHAQRAIELIKQVEQEFEERDKKEQEKEEENSKPKGKIIYGGSKTCDASTGYVCPTLILNPPRSCRVMREEIFSPILPILTVSSRDEAIKLIDSMALTQEAGGEGIKAIPLALYCFTGSNKVFDHVIDRCPASMTVRNDSIIQFGSCYSPVGGMGGSSGYGRYHGKFSFDTFSHHLPIMSRPCFSGSDMNMMRFHPFDNSWGKGRLIVDVFLKMPGYVPVFFRRSANQGSAAILDYIFLMLHLIILLLVIGILGAYYQQMPHSLFKFS